MDIQKVVTAVVLSIATSQVFALDCLPGDAVIQVGKFWSTPGRQQSVSINGLIGDEFLYSPEHQQDSNGLLGLGYYVDGYFNNRYIIQYGINAFYLANTTTTGKIVQEQLFTNLAYSYNVTNFPIYLAAKAQLDSNSKYNLTFDFGLGANIISTSHYTETSLDGGITVPDHSFSGKTNTAFSLTTGVGLKFNNVFGQVPLECGYRFFYLGRGRFNTLTNQITSELSTGNNHANAIVCSVTI